MSMKGRNLIANGEPATVSTVTEGYGETFLTLEHRETGEEMGTVEASEVGL